MEQLRRRWWVVGLLSLALGVAIAVLAPHYTDAQGAADARAFRAAVDDDGSGRMTAAGLVDIAFALSYALVAVALTRRHVATRVGAALVGLGAAADIVENVLLLVGVGREDDLTDGTLDAMRAFGAVKWVAIGVGTILQLFGLLRDRHRAST